MATKEQKETKDRGLFLSPSRIFFLSFWDGGESKKKMNALFTRYSQDSTIFGYFEKRKKREIGNFKKHRQTCPMFSKIPIISTYFSFFLLPTKKAQSKTKSKRGTSHSFSALNTPPKGKKKDKEKENTPNPSFHFFL